MADIKIDELIGEAVTKAVERRNQAMGTEAALSDLCDEESGKVAGGLNIGVGDLICTPTTMGIISKPPITTGIILRPPIKF